jgi:organic radical activating enzyme
MVIKQLVDEDFVNYKKPSMFIAFPSCSWKCEKECGKKMCQNSTLATSPSIDIDINSLIERYMNNPITQAIVCGGLEPMDSWWGLVKLIHAFRKHTNDDIVIYTGYYEYEINDDVEYLRQNYHNIIFKFGRYIPNQQKHYDEVLGIELASDNQYGVKIS